MYFRRLFAVTGLSAALLAPALALSASAPRPPCVFNEYRVTSVKPYRVTTQVGRSPVTRLAGAQLYVAAQPGLTAQWLESKLLRHAQQMRGTSMKNCVFDLANIKVDVNSAGPGFVVKLIAKDGTNAEEVLNRARLQLTSM